MAPESQKLVEFASSSTDSRDDDLETLRAIYECIGQPSKRSAAVVSLAGKLALEHEPSVKDQTLAGLTTFLQKVARAPALPLAEDLLSPFLRQRIQEVISVCVQLEISRVQRDISQLALDRMHRAVIVVNEKAKTLLTNHSAREILRQNDGLRIEQERLAAVRSNETIELRQLIQKSVEANESTNRRFAMMLSRPSHRRALALLISPSTVELDGSGEGLQRVILVFVNDPEAESPIEQDVLCRMYGLTRAEARLASEIVNGKSPEEAASALCVSIKTVRTHLHRIFLKTETTRQSQLVQQLMRTVL